MDKTHCYTILADLTVIIHAAFVAFVVVGQVLVVIGWLKKWLWTQNFWFRVLHLAAISLVVLEAWLGISCPLTLLEYYWRDLAIETTSQANHESFIRYWIHYFLFYTFPEWIFIVIYTLFGSMVLVTFFKYPPRH